MKSYLDIVVNVLEKGKWKKPVRRNADGTETILPHDTLALPNQLFSHNMSDGFPLLTTKKMPLRTILVELEGFINGITDKSWYQERRCNIWNEWANPKAVYEALLAWQKEHAKDYEDGKSLVEASVKLKPQMQKVTSDLGPIYGYQWRGFDSHYGTYDEDGLPAGIENGVPWGTDQLTNIVNTLHKNPYDRRMVYSAWNPNQIDMMALPPCHYAWNVTVIGDEINLFWAQRSCDLMLGVPFNIASYATLLLLLAKESGFKPGNLSGMLVDCHIYANHIDGVKEQLTREPRELPQLEIMGDIYDKFDIFKWTHSYVSLMNYNPHPKIQFGEVTV